MNRRPEPPLAARLYELPPRPEDVTPDDVLDRFLAFVKERGLTLYPAQEEALLELVQDKNVILATPTGSGCTSVTNGVLCAIATPSTPGRFATASSSAR